MESKARKKLFKHKDNVINDGIEQDSTTNSIWLAGKPIEYH